MHQAHRSNVDLSRAYSFSRYISSKKNYTQETKCFTYFKQKNAWEEITCHRNLE